MKKIIFLIAGMAILAVSSIQAENAPSKASSLPAPLKRKIVKSIDYSGFTEQHKIEGDVLLKFALSDESTLEIIDLSATNQELGNFVKKELASMKIKNSALKSNQTYYLKIKFDLLSEQ